jgi:hypothetical protein
VPLAHAFGTHSEAVAIAPFPAARSQLLRAFSAAVISCGILVNIFKVFNYRYRSTEKKSCQ